MQGSLTAIIFLSRGCATPADRTQDLHCPFTGPLRLTERPRPAVCADFASKNCRRELYAALDADVPLILVHEADEAKGGAPLEEMQTECRERCTDSPASGARSAGALDGATICSRVFDEQEPIVWVRVHDFQLVSLRLIALMMLRHTPHFTRHPRSLERGLCVPGELGEMRLDAPSRLLVCQRNEGAACVAAELQRAALAACGGRVPFVVMVAGAADEEL